MVRSINTDKWDDRLIEILDLLQDIVSGNDSYVYLMQKVHDRCSPDEFEEFETMNI